MRKKHDWTNTQLILGFQLVKREYGCFGSKSERAVKKTRTLKPNELSLENFSL